MGRRWYVGGEDIFLKEKSNENDKGPTGAVVAFAVVVEGRLSFDAYLPKKAAL